MARKENIQAKLLKLEGGVSDGMKRMGHKEQVWGIKLPSKGGKTYGKDLPYTEKDIPDALKDLKFDRLNRDEKALVAAASEFVWGERIDPNILEYRDELRRRKARGEKLSEIEQTALNLRTLDTDMF